MPVRYSVRTHPREMFSIGTSNDDLVKLERKILNNELEFEYKPSEIETMFAMDDKTHEI